VGHYCPEDLLGDLSIEDGSGFDTMLTWIVLDEVVVQIVEQTGDLPIACVFSEMFCQSDHYLRYEY
jgi:hypothetical protein